MLMEHYRLPLFNVTMLFAEVLMETLHIGCSDAIYTL